MSKLQTISGGLLIALLGVSAARAEPVCAPSARMPAQNYPGVGAIPTGNNLLLPAGKAVAAPGQRIVITGRILDVRCIPVPGAVVELWQNSPTGRWLLAGQDDLATPNPVFAGAGRTYTDGDGRFTFITAFPAPLGVRAPFVNIKASGEVVTTHTTALFFSEDARNERDAAYRKLAPRARESVTIRVAEKGDGSLTGTIDLVLSGKAKYRTY